jgi:hypothetical protein
MPYTPPNDLVKVQKLFPILNYSHTIANIPPKLPLMQKCFSLDFPTIHAHMGISFLFKLVALQVFPQTPFN